MDKNNSSLPQNARDTFLSRVFGLQSEEVSSSIHTEEMSNFAEERAQESQNGTPRNHSPTEDEDQTSGDEELRIPESDQGTTTEEEDLHTEDVELDATSAYNDVVAKKAPVIEDSMLKVGQLSSDEEYRDETEEEDDEGAGDDTPLFDKTLRTAKQPDHVSHSLLFQRILQHNQGKRKNQQLFTSSKDGHKKGELREPDLEAGRAENFRKQELRGTSNTAFKLKRPNLINNISVLNNTPISRLNTLSPKERALWKWANVENLDTFFQDVYRYYLGNGYFCIVLEKILNIATLIFVVFISTYMGYCIDYSKLPDSHKLAEVTVEHCYSRNITGTTKFLLWVFYIFVVLKVAQLYFDVQNLRDIHNFYNYLLNISDKELQTIPWQNIIQQIMYLKDQNALTANVVEVKAKNRIDAHDIANRIMRKENYLIAMYNNDVLNLSLPVPLYRTSTLTKTLEWNINLCIMGYAFNESSFIKQSFLKASQQEYLKEELQKRFMLAGFLNIILSPFLVAYFLLLYFFRYFNEYKTSPGSLGARQYTPMADWKFREYNELYHLFQRRIGLSAGLADKYINQFPKEGTNIFLRFVAFVSGSFVAVLALLTIFDPENFFNFEITHERTALFYITILGAVWTVCKNSVSDDYNVFDPEKTISELASYTHYLPDEWNGRYHTEEVKNEFCKLYNLRIIILLRELASLVLTPFILWFSLPKSADKIVEFFRETSVYVDGLGYVCKYAMFGVNEPKEFPEGKVQQGSSKQARAQSTSTSDNAQVNSEPEESDEEENGNAINKMMQSYLYFIDDYENSDNAVGKHQVPLKRFDELKKVPDLSNSYSWKKQFQPGQRPELFRIGKHSLERRSSVPQPTAQEGASKGTANKKSFTQSGDRNRTLGESFINSVPSGNRDNSGGREGNSREQGGGVLGLVKEFYKNQI